MTTHRGESDHDRIVRIEMAVDHIKEKLAVHMEELRAHIRDERASVDDLRAAMAAHLQEARIVMTEVDELKRDVSKLKYERVRIISWVAGVVFIIGLGWVVFQAWLDHRQDQAMFQEERTRNATP